MTATVTEPAAGRPNGFAARLSRRGSELTTAARAEPAALVLGVVILVWIVVFSWLVVLRQQRFGTIDFDLGIHDQSIWLLSRGKDFVTVRGLPVFGHHATFAYYLLVPLAWLGAGPNVWNILQVVAIASAAIPLYLLARDRVKNTWVAATLGVVWLLQPPLQFFAWETFHPEVMAIPFIFWAYWLGEKRRWVGFGICLLLALCWKEDISLLVAGLGLVYLIRGRWRLGAAVVAAGMLWFAVFAVWMVPHVAGGKTVYGPLYGSLGDTPAEVLKSGITDPGAIAQRLSDNDAGGYARDLLAPFGFTPLAAPEMLLLGLPQAGVNLLSTADFTFDLRYHYQALPMVALGLGMVEGVARLWRWRRGVGYVAVGAAGVCALVASNVTGLSPIGQNYRIGYWPLTRSPAAVTQARAVALIGSTDGVSADYNDVPHLTHRDIVYTFPNPWRNKNYGISTTAMGDPAKVEWLLVNTGHFDTSDRSLYERLMGSGEFVVRLQDGPIVLAQRVRPPGLGGG